MAAHANTAFAAPKVRRHQDHGTSRSAPGVLLRDSLVGLFGDANTPVVAGPAAGVWDAGSAVGGVGKVGGLYDFSAQIEQARGHPLQHPVFTLTPA